MGPPTGWRTPLPALQQPAEPLAQGADHLAHLPTIHSCLHIRIHGLQLLLTRTPRLALCVPLKHPLQLCHQAAVLLWGQQRAQAQTHQPEQLPLHGCCRGDRQELQAGRQQGGAARLCCTWPSCDYSHCLCSLHSRCRLGACCFCSSCYHLCWKRCSARCCWCRPSGAASGMSCCCCTVRGSLSAAAAAPCRHLSLLLLTWTVHHINWGLLLDGHRAPYNHCCSTATTLCQCCTSSCWGRGSGKSWGPVRGAGNVPGWQLLLAPA